MFDELYTVHSILLWNRVDINKNNALSLHYKVTSIVLLLSGGFIFQRQFFGESIDCIGDQFDKSTIGKFCFGSSFTYNTSGDSSIPPEEERIYHRYYPWVWLFLIFQAFLFYLPRYFWKVWEGEKLRNLVLGLNFPLIRTEERSERLDLLKSYLRANRNHLNFYFYRYLFCEILSLVNIFLQVYLVNLFFNGYFSGLGFSQNGISDQPTDDLSIKIFPNLAKCTFRVADKDHAALCILVLNGINQKIYVFFWFWLIFLTLISVLLLFETILQIFSRRMRFWNLKSSAFMTERNQLKSVLEDAKIGDWFILYLLSKNLDTITFTELIKEMRQSSYHPPSNFSAVFPARPRRDSS